MTSTMTAFLEQQTRDVNRVLLVLSSQTSRVIAKGVNDLELEFVIFVLATLHREWCNP
jgi:hypothetical protein